MPADALHRLLHLGGELYTPPGQPRRKFDLEHVRLLLAQLGNPQQRFQSILIAGTNGKGSTAATLASILAAAGHSTGLYTSPHLVRVNERVQFSTSSTGESQLFREIEDHELFAYLSQVEKASAALVDSGQLPATPSFFETMTAIAMLAFAERGIRYAVLEVGMGGRLDATNVVEPILSIITDISLDHTEWLGSTLSEIAREKAGILREGGLMVTLPQHPEVNQVLGEIAIPLGVQALNAVEFLPGRELASDGPNEYELRLGADVLQVRSPLAGSHQRRNLALAIAAALALRSQRGVEISLQQIEDGVRRTAWPGRLERFALAPGRPEVLLDVAHNPAGAWALRAALNREGTGGPKHLIFGCMRDKALREMAQVLFPVFDHVWLVEVPSPRAASVEELKVSAEAVGARYSVAGKPTEALEKASAALEGTAGGLVVAAGSVVLVGEVRAALAGARFEHA